MKLYIFENLSHVSDRYHDDGGLVVVAEGKRAAKALIAAHPEAVVTDDEWAGKGGLFEPVVIHEIKVADDTRPRVIVFPNAGCC